MSPENFCYWLQGFIEIRKASGDPGLSLNSHQVQVIANHLNLVFTHAIDPKAGGPEVQKVLNDIHQTGTASSGQITVSRC